MPLNWDARRVKDWESLPEDSKYSVIEHTMSFGIGQIKKGNVDKWCDRAKFMRLVHGPTLWIPADRSESGEDHHLLEDREFMSKFIGLHTNASNIPQGKWLKRLFEGKASDWAWQRRQQCSGE